ncbi:MAG TPA: GAF domain-containing protein [Gaiellaceae bacterium]|nr:GAF domain-containing protein [Gaiellaceae bacterium]
MDHHARVIALEAGPLLLLAALYLGVALALAPQLWRGRGLSLPGFGIWTLFVVLGAVGAVVGTGVVLDQDFLSGIDPWPAFGVTLFAYLPALFVLARWPERAVLLEGGRRLREAEEKASQHRRDAEAISRLSTALTHTASEGEAAARLFDELESALRIERALLAIVDEDERRARGLAARGVDEAWWREVTLDLDRDQGGIVTVTRERTPFAVFDAASAPNLNRSLVEATEARSAAFVPLLSEGRVAGVLVAVSTTPRLFSATEMELMVDLANETALALGRSRSAEALQLALDRERLVAKISRRVRSELDLDAVLQVAVEEVGRALGVSRCFIRLGEPRGPLPIRAEWTAEGLEPIGDASERLPASNMAARERRTVAIADVERAAELDARDPRGREMLLGLGTRSVLATPILVFDRMIGVFALHRAEAGLWSAGEVSLTEAVAREIGLAVHTAQLLNQNTRRLEEQAALLKAAQVLTSDLRFESVIQRLVHEVVKLLRADAADCWIFDGHRRLLRCRAVFGVDEGNVGREIAPAGTFKEVIESGRPVLKRNFATTEEPPPSSDFAVFAEVMDAPITWLGEARGVLGVCARKDGHFDLADLELLDTFARLASLALHNAESFEERVRQAQVQRGFYRIAEILGSTLSLAETVDALAQAACDALGGAAALVLEPRGDRLHVAGSHDVPAVLAAELAGGLPDSVAPFGASAREERILTASSLADDERLAESLRTLLQEIGYRSLLCAPVAGARGQLNAAVVLFVGEREFSDDDLALARHLAGAARGAIERSELFEGERRARAFSQRLADVGGVLATKLDPTAAFNEVVREAPALLEASAAVVRVLEDDELVVRAASGERTGDLVRARSSSAAGVAGAVAQSRSSLAVGDARSTPRFVREDPLLRAGQVAVVAVPMFAHGGGFHGVLSVYDRRPRIWRDDEMQALAALAATAAAAFSSANLYARVAEEKERSEAILANIADGIVVVDRNDAIVLWNATAEQITGVPAEEALGRRVSDVLQRELASEMGASPRERQISIPRGGKEVWLSLTEAVMADAAGSVAGRIFTFRDVSSERVVEQMKSDFVATVSHELRTPLTSIYGFAETLLRSDVAFSEAERRTFLGYIGSESERLINIVDDLLNVARLEAGTLGLNIASTDVREVVGETVSRFAERVDGTVSFDVHLPRTLVRVRADKEKLKQIVMNLIDNAVKFSPDGGQISVSARRRSDTVEIRVADEGIGIPRADQQRIFTKFYRSEQAALHSPQGTGLGLFLARGLLAAMGGRIWVESTEGEGSTFVFELPVAADGPGRPARAPEPAASAG